MNKGLEQRNNNDRCLCSAALQAAVLTLPPRFAFVFLALAISGRDPYLRELPPSQGGQPRPAQLTLLPRLIARNLVGEGRVQCHSI